MMLSNDSWLTEDNAILYIHLPQISEGKKFQFKIEFYIPLIFIEIQC